MDRLSFADLHRFIASLGLALVAVALALPWLYTRANFDAHVTVSQYEALTEVGQAMVVARQRHGELLLAALPWMSGILFLVGIAALWRGLAKWGQMQAMRDADEVRKLTPAEQQAKLLQELLEDQGGDVPDVGGPNGSDSVRATPSVAEDVPAPQDARQGSTSQEDALTDEQVSGLRRQVFLRSEMEKGVTELLQAVFGQEQVKSQVMVGTSKVDGVITLADGKTTVLVEVKTVRTLNALKPMVMRAQDQLQSAKQRLHRPVRVLVILVVKERVHQAVRDIVADLSRGAWVEGRTLDTDIVVLPERAVHELDVSLFRSLLGAVFNSRQFPKA